MRWRDEGVNTDSPLGVQGAKQIFHFKTNNITRFYLCCCKTSDSVTKIKRWRDEFVLQGEDAV